MQKSLDFNQKIVYNTLSGKIRFIKTKNRKAYPKC